MKKNTSISMITSGHPVAAIIMLSVCLTSLCLIGCAGCGGVKEKVVTKENIITPDSIDKTVDNKDSNKNQSYKSPSKPGLTIAHRNFDVYHFDTLSNYQHPTDMVKVELRSKAKSKRVIYPLKELDYFNENTIEIQETFSAGKIEHYYNVNTGKERQEQIHITIYEQGDFLGVQLTSYEISGFSDVHDVVTEFIFFDSLGAEIVHLTREGEVSNVSISADKKYAFINSGGQYTEDTFLPYRFAFYNVSNDQYIVEKEFEKDCVHGSQLSKNYARISLMENCSNLSNNATLFYRFETKQWFYYNSSDCVNNIGYRQQNDNFVCHSRSLNQQIVINPETDFEPIEDFMSYINQMK